MKNYPCTLGWEMTEQSLAIVVLVICVVLLGRLAMSPWRRARMDAWAAQKGNALRVHAMRLTRRRKAQAHATQVAEEAIRKARHRAQRDGNVVRPDAFRRDPRKPH